MEYYSAIKRKRLDSVMQDTGVKNMLNGQCKTWQHILYDFIYINEKTRQTLSMVIEVRDDCLWVGNEQLPKKGHKQTSNKIPLLEKVIRRIFLLIDSMGQTHGKLLMLSPDPWTVGSAHCSQIMNYSEDIALREWCVVEITSMVFVKYPYVNIYIIHT